MSEKVANDDATAENAPTNNSAEPEIAAAIETKSAENLNVDVEAAEAAQQEQNLVYSRQKIRNLRILLTVIAVIVVIGLLATAIVLVLRNSDKSESLPAKQTNTIQLEDVLSGHLSASDFNGTWSGTEIVFRDGADHSIVSLDVKTGKRTTLMRAARQYHSYFKSPDGQYLLLTKNPIKNFRHSFAAFYEIYNIASGETYPLLFAGEQRLLWLVQWAPVGNALIFNYLGNLYYQRNALKDSEVLPITNDENPNILNGIPDWIYEEEVLSTNYAVWFNPNGSQIAFIQFDNSATYSMNLQEYGEAGDLRYQYPLNKRVPYPKAGSPNPRVRLITADLSRVGDGSDSHLTDVPLPAKLNTEADYIIAGVQWLTNESLLSTWMNRIQTRLHMQMYNGLKRFELYSLESKTGWVNIFETPQKNRDGSVIALILPQKQGNDGNYRHLCLLGTRNANEEPEPITKGKFEVQSILHWDLADDIIFYTANTEANTEVLHIYAVKPSSPLRVSQCMTCKNMHVSGDIPQSYYSADFNDENQVAIQSAGPGIPMTDIYEWKFSNNQVMWRRLMDWESNIRLHADIAKLAMPETELLNIPIEHGFIAKVMLHLPPNMDRSGKTKYPMLVDVYGGPDSYSVINRWSMDWGMYLTSNQSVIYAKIDGRGSGLRGEKLLHSIYLKLGSLEIEDQINVTKQLQQKYSWIDAAHTAIWGWSYGGYAAAMALANDNGHVFNCAASVAPVTDWAYYDSIYTERYMSLPKLNEEGYNNSRLSTRAQQLRGKKYMLIHGTLDDNVHYQQALVLAKNLERQNVLFKQISYTDEDHSLIHVRPHLYHSLDRFFGDCFASSSLMRSRK